MIRSPLYHCEVSAMSEYRDIITIDDEKCTGCGLCVPNCPEGALQIIDGKARLVSDLFCDGLGACIGNCPEGAISIEKREAEPYDETRVMDNIVQHGENTIKAHLQHLKSHGALDYLSQALTYLKEHDIPVPELEHTGCPPGGCPGSAMHDFREETPAPVQETAPEPNTPARSQLQQWPVQLTLVPVSAPYFQNADLVIAADCVPFTYPDFHGTFLKGKALAVGCPKLDDAAGYQTKLTAVFSQNTIRSVTVVHMEVPCCHGLPSLVKSAMAASGKIIPYAEVEINIRGEIKR